jgi:hypothetical protein
LKTENLPRWVPQIFPTAKRTRAGGFRVASADLGRGFEEDLGIDPRGIKFFGIADMGDKRQGRRTAVELVADFQQVEAPQAAEWLEKTFGGNGHDTESQEPPPPEPEPQAESATDADVEITRLAKLSALQYEQERKDAAEKLNVRASILDRLVAAERTRLGLDGADDKQGHAIEFPEPESWPELVDGAALLNRIAPAIRKHVVMPNTSSHVAALWVLHSWLINCFVISPRLCVRSATKGCGKTLLLDVLGRLVRRPLRTLSITPAATFRIVEGWQPTLLIDEADTFLNDNEGLRGILDGNRKGDTVLRTVGDDFEVRAFATYAAVTIALIGTLPDTLHDRSVVIDLKRRLPKEKIAPFRFDRAGHLDVLARMAARWAADNAERVAAKDPEMPKGVINREADNWRPLAAIAAVAGGRWPARLAKATEAAHVAGADDAASRLELLLGDIRDAFKTDKAETRLDMFGAEQIEITSADMVKALVGLDGRPWAEMGRNRKPMTQNRLARMLKPLGIAPHPIGPEDGRLRGYALVDFKDAFERYLAPLPAEASQPSIRPERDEMGTSDISQPSSPNPGWTVAKCEKPSNDGLLDGWTVAKGGDGEKAHVRAARPRSEYIPYVGLVVEMPEPPPDLLDEHGAPQPTNGGTEPGLSAYSIRELAEAYQERTYAQYEESGSGDVDHRPLDAWLRQRLREMVLPEHIEIEFKRVMDAVFAI